MRSGRSCLCAVSFAISAVASSDPSSTRSISWIRPMSGIRLRSKVAMVDAALRAGITTETMARCEMLQLMVVASGFISGSMCHRVCPVAMEGLNFRPGLEIVNTESRSVWFESAPVQESIIKNFERGNRQQREALKAFDGLGGHFKWRLFRQPFVGVSIFELGRRAQHITTQRFDVARAPESEVEA